MQTLKSKLLQGTSLSKPARKFEVKLAGADATKHKAFGQHEVTSEGLAAFVREFVLSLDNTIAMVNRLLEIFRGVDPTWLRTDSHSECKAQVWSLTMGIKATAPRVGKELKRHLLGLERVAEASKAAKAILERKSRAQQERNHYLLKLQVLHEESTERQRKGQQNSADQVQRLKRNEEKLAYAQQQLDDCNEEADAALDAQLKRNQELLVSALHGAAQVTTCGWFVSTGAVICQALHNAAAEARSECSEDQQKQDQPSGGQDDASAPSKRVEKGMMALPPMLSEDNFEPAVRFDPADPLAPDKTGPLPEQSGLAEDLKAKAAAAADGEQGEDVPLEQLSVRELRELLRLNGLSDAGCVEKAELVQRLRAASTDSPPSALSGSAPSSPSRPRAQTAPVGPGTTATNPDDASTSNCPTPRVSSTGASPTGAAASSQRTPDVASATPQTASPPPPVAQLKPPPPNTRPSRRSRAPKHPPPPPLEKMGLGEGSSPGSESQGSAPCPSPQASPSPWPTAPQSHSPSPQPSPQSADAPAQRPWPSASSTGAWPAPTATATPPAACPVPSAASSGANVNGTAGSSTSPTVMQAPWPQPAWPGPSPCGASKASGTWPQPPEGSKWPRSPDSQVATPVCAVTPPSGAGVAFGTTPNSGSSNSLFNSKSGGNAFGSSPGLAVFGSNQSSGGAGTFASSPGVGPIAGSCAAESWPKSSGPGGGYWPSGQQARTALPGDWPK